MQFLKKFSPAGIFVLSFLFGLYVWRPDPSCDAPKEGGTFEAASTAVSGGKCDGIFGSETRARVQGSRERSRNLSGPSAGTSFRVKMPGPFRDYAKKRVLKFLEMNMLNLFERDFALLGRTEAGTAEKTQAQQNALGRTLREANADVMVLVEVENQAAADKFQKKYLDDQYVVFVVEGNDPRGIDIAMLVKKDLPFEVEYRTFKSEMQNGQQVFSRDLPVAVFRRMDVNGLPQEYVLIGTHYKSKRGNGDDSTEKRRVQANVTAEIMADLRAEFGPETPIFLTGDFNNEIRNSPEFTALWKLGLEDALDLSPNPVPPDQRGTHFYFDPSGKREVNHIDGFLVYGAQSVKVSSAKILPHLDENGKVLPWPETFDQREKLPSDHLPTEVIAEMTE